MPDYTNQDIELTASDIEIGAVELKNATTDDRAILNAANTARTTSTVVLTTQNIDASGKVKPSGDTVGNAPFTKITDGTDTALITAGGSQNVLEDNSSDIKTSVQLIDDAVAAEASAAGKGIQIILDNGVNSTFAQCDGSGYLKTISQAVKTIQTELLAITAVVANAQQKSSELDVSNIKNITLFIDHARDAATAFVGAGTEYRVQTSEKATGNDTWRTLYSVVCDITAASSIVMDTEEAAGSTRIETGATLPAVGGEVFFKNATIANSEWAKVIAIIATDGAEYFDILDGLTNAQAAITLFNKSEHFVLSFSLNSIKRIRCIVNNANGTTNQAIVSRIACITE